MLSAHAASSESSKTSCPTVPQPGPQPRGAKLLELGVKHRQWAGEVGLALAALDNTLGRGLGGSGVGSSGAQRLAEHRAGAAVRGCPLGPAEHQGEQASGESGP